MDRTFSLGTSPHLHSGDAVPRIMGNVIVALLPVMGAAVFFFGIRVVMMLVVSCGTCLFTEHLCQKLRKRETTIADGSALVTGLLLVLILPPSLPLWVVALGAIVGIGMGKMVFGGLGHNKFNPALVGRAFLQAAFPVWMTTWSLPVESLTALKVAATTGATPLAAMKFHAQAGDLPELFWGNVAGSTGETSAVAILIGGIFLAFRRIADWRIIIGVISTTLLFSGVLWEMDPASFGNPLFQILSGGFLLGTFFMATDMVASPTTPRGRWVYGGGIGLLIVLIRTFSGLPEGVMYAILLMNAVSPLIERYSQPRRYGHVNAT